MARRGRGLTEEESRLWSGVTRSVTPFAKQPASASLEKIAGAKSPSGKPPAKATPSVAATRATAKSSPSPPPLAPLERRFRQRIARGSAAIEARLDLHGMTQAKAHGALLHFLRREQGRGTTLALVITGKGARFSGASGETERGVLKRQVPLWLRLPEFRGYVVGFDEAAIPHGGAGALYVRLRKKRG